MVAIFFGKLSAGETPRVFGDGLQTRDYVYVGDVVRANLAALDYTGPEETFNIGTGTETSVLDLLAACQDAAGTAVSPQHEPARLGELARSALDCRRAARELAGAPRWASATASRRRSPRFAPDRAPPRVVRPTREQDFHSPDSPEPLDVASSGWATH